MADAREDNCQPLHARKLRPQHVPVGQRPRKPAVTACKLSPSTPSRQRPVRSFNALPRTLFGTRDQLFSALIFYLPDFSLPFLMLINPVRSGLALCRESSQIFAPRVCPLWLAFPARRAV